MSEKVGVRPCGILIEKGKVLCILCKYDEEFYLFPGGGLEPGETIGEGVEREFFEETGLKVKAKKMVYVNDWIKDRKTNTRVLNVFFLVQRTGGKISLGEKDDGKVKKVKWIPLKEFKKIDFRPKYLAKRLESDFKKGFKEVLYFN